MSVAHPSPDAAALHQSSPSSPPFKTHSPRTSTPHSLYAPSTPPTALPAHFPSWYAEHPLQQYLPASKPEEPNRSSLHSHCLPSQCPSAPPYVLPTPTILTTFPCLKRGTPCKT